MNNKNFTIDLVYPSSVTKSENYSSEPPLGLVALYSSLRKGNRKNIKLLDSTIMTQTQIEAEIETRKSNLVAISCTSFNYSNAIKIAEIAKNNSSLVIVGGIHITFLQNQILKKIKEGKRPFDFLVAGFGEPVFDSLITSLKKGNPLNKIPNLSYFDNERIKKNKKKVNTYKQDPLMNPINYEIVDLNKYNPKFKRFGNLENIHSVGSIFTQRGCPYKGDKQCLFCSIERHNIRRSYSLIRNDLISLMDQHNIDHIRINDADFTKNVKHMRSIANISKNISHNSKKLSFYCFIRSNEINETTLALLKEINVIAVLIGYESGSDEMLNSIQKNTSVIQHLNATQLLMQNGIDVVSGSFVLGGIGESGKTLYETLRFIEKLRAIGNVRSLAATPLIPLPGSLAFTRLLETLEKEDFTKFKELRKIDNFDILELVELWNKYMCKASLPQIIKTIEKIEASLNISIRFHNFSQS